MKYLFFFLSVVLMLSCNDTSEDQAKENPGENRIVHMREGKWKMELEVNSKIIPFNFKVGPGEKSIAIINADETIKVDDIVREGDSLFIGLPYFDSGFRMKMKDNETMSGKWIKGESYSIPAKGYYNKSRFPLLKTPGPSTFEGKWEITFSPGSEKEYKAIGLFEQEGHYLNGTILTETGDYRYLEGAVRKDSLYLSAFDGSHAFLFEAHQTKDTLKGIFLSGKHWSEGWTAIRNDSFQLRHPDSLTYMKKGYDSFSFSFPGLDSQIVSLSDPRFEKKVVIVSIMGSWCPNCMDEAIFLNELQKKYGEKGLEIVAIAFEKSGEFSKAVKNVKKFKKDLGLSYTFLIGGKAGKKETAAHFPMLNNIMSYPTAIFIGRSGKIRNIHTGFYGPGTGKYYEDFVESKELLVKKLLEAQ